MTLSQADIDALVGGGKDADAPAYAGAVGSAPAVEPSVGAAVHKGAAQAEVHRILGLSMPVSVIVASREMDIKSLLALTVGSIIEFDVMFDADLDLQIGGHSIARGQAVKVGENFGIRITVVETVHERIDALGNS
ncbi:MAG: FliM/FliN family flagellar motor switch protein [Planctomycetes bacterium]|nr:FliM/FliN family flagellar motor switch protein [Planctomycetota bacterium]